MATYEVTILSCHGQVFPEQSARVEPLYKANGLCPACVLKLHLRYYPTSRKTSKARKATAVIVSMILIVVSCIAAVYAFR